jgi:hypothetical protein
MRGPLRNPLVVERVHHLKEATRKLGPLGLIILPPVMAGTLIASAHTSGVLNDDFRRSVWQAGTDVLAGRSPYGLVDPANPVAGDRALYPPVFIFATLPFALVSFQVASALWAACLLGGLAGGLWLLGVRDWRCYSMVAMSWPVLLGFVFGNVSLLLVPAIALVWRLRDTVWRLGLLTAILIAVKLFLWPLVGWLVIRGRYRAAIAAGAGSVVAILAPWALIGFAGLTDYPGLLNVHTEAWGSRSLSIYAIASELGASGAIASTICTVCALALLVVARYVGRQGDDASSFAVVLVAAIVSSPIVWQHYFALLIVPVAIAAPRLSGLWLTLPAFWVILLSADDTAGGLVNDYQRTVVWTIVAVTLVLTIRALRKRRQVARHALLPRLGSSQLDTAADQAA